MLVRVAVRVIVQSLHVPIRSPQRDIVEATDGQCGLRVGWGDEAFLFKIAVSKQKVL